MGGQSLPNRARMWPVQVAVLMSENRITGLPVCEGADGKLLGVISRSDMLRVISEGVDCEMERPRPPWCDSDEGDVALAELESIEGMEVRGAMHDAVTVPPGTTMAEAAQLMYPKRLNRLVVTDPAGKVLGILTSTDVMRVALCDELSELDYGDL